MRKRSTLGRMEENRRPLLATVCLSVLFVAATAVKAPAQGAMVSRTKNSIAGAGRERMMRGDTSYWCRGASGYGRRIKVADYGTLRPAGVAPTHPRRAGQCCFGAGPAYDARPLR